MYKYSVSSLARAANVPVVMAWWYGRYGTYHLGAKGQTDRVSHRCIGTFSREMVRRRIFEGRHRQ